MTRGGLAVTRNERALSEVVGFVLILGIITAAFSLYLVYGVPAQGRENEINHMNDVKDQFVAYKIGLDALWVNHQTGTTVSNAFTLGTGGGYTQGSNSIIPILSPVSSSGVIGINERGAENLTITSQSLIQTDTAVKVDDLPTTVNISPRHIYVNISNLQLSDFASDRRLGIQVNGNGWQAIVNLTPRTTYYRNFTLNGQTLIPEDKYNYTHSDLTLTVIKNNQITLQDFIVQSNASSGKLYTIDLLDPTYGLNNFITYPVALTFSTYDPNPTATSHSLTGNVTYGFSELNITSTIPLGSLEYRAQNNYWIPQTYYYQLGGVFLYQPTVNGTIPKLPPEIDFTYNSSASNIVTVNINALALKGNGLVGGNSPVQLKTTLINQSSLPYVQGLSGNSRWINIAVTTPDPAAREMWRNYFNATAQAQGIPDSYYRTDISGNDAFIQINGYDTTSNNFDVNVVAQNATYAVNVHGVGGALQ
jgi:hypothetical protein